jgi:hypothetical protein
MGWNHPGNSDRDSVNDCGKRGRGARIEATAAFAFVLSSGLGRAV